MSSFMLFFALCVGILSYGNQMEIIFMFKVSEQHSQNLRCAVETTITCADVVGSLDSSNVFKFETLFLILERFTLLGCNITDLLAFWWIVPRLQIARAKGNEDQSCRDVGTRQNPEDNLPLMVGIL